MAESDKITLKHLRMSMEKCKENMDLLDEDKAKKTYITPEEFGAKGDGVTDDTQSIIDTLTYAFNNGIKNICYSRKYKVSKMGSTTLINYAKGTAVNYSFLISDKSDLNFYGNGTFITDFSTDIYTVFHFVNCSNVIVNGLNCIRYGGDSKYLYNGAFVTFELCTNCKSTFNNTVNTMHNTIALASTSCVMENCKSIRDSYGMLTGAHFGIYKSKYCDAIKCTTYGGCNDGDISLYGAGKGNRVLNCFVTSTLESAEFTPVKLLQGICVDSGESDAIISNNIVFGEYYGIDVKTNTNNVLVESNICVANKYGIAIRLGEGNAPAYNTQVVSNIVLCDSNYDIFTEKNETGYSGAAVHGIVAQRACGFTIANNLIKAREGQGTLKYAGIEVVDNTDTDAAKSNLSSISCNKILLYSYLGTDFNKSEEMGIYIGSTGDGKIIKDIKINDNIIEGVVSADAKPFIKVINATDISIENNRLSKTKRQQLEVINSSKIYIKNNVFESSSGNVAIDTCNNIDFTGNSIISTAEFIPSVQLTNSINCRLLSNTYGGGSSDNEDVLFKLTNCDNIIMSSNIASYNRSLSSIYRLENTTTDQITDQNNIVKVNSSVI